MMKKMTYKYLCLLAVLPSAMASCSTENDIASGDSVPMTFTCSAVPQSRTDYGAFTGNDFGVMAKSYSGDYKTTDGSVVMNNVEVTYSDGICSTRETCYWPELNTETVPRPIPVHFAAYAPYSADPTSANGMSITLPQKPYQGYTFSGKVDGKTNWMFANEQYGTIDDFSNNVNCAVPMNFNHTLTQVKFQAALADGTDTKYKLNIEGLTLRNVRHTGNITFKHNNKDFSDVIPADDANKWNTENMLWTVGKEFQKGSEYDADYLGDYTVSVDDRMTGIYTTLREFNDCLYLMPQQLYDDTNSEFPQQLEVTYSITTNDVKGGSVTSTIPLKLDDIQQWTINKSIVYSLIMTPTRGVQLSVAVQPWELEAFENQFSNTVSVNDDGKIVWTDDTYDYIDDNIVVLKNDINYPAEFSFTIASPMGGTWKAFFVTQSGNPNAFTISPSEGPVGRECTVTIAATEENKSNTANKAELCFVVTQAGQILPVDILTTLSDNRNYVILQNINK